MDSQRNTLVQLADLVAGSVYAWHKSGDRTVQLISGKFGASLVENWRYIKGALVVGQQKTEHPGGYAPQKRGKQINCLPTVPGLTFRFQA